MKKMNLLLFISTIIICIFGIVMITSSSYIWAEYKFNDPYKFMKSQVIFFILGLIVMIFVSKIDCHIYYKYANKIFIAIIILLVLVLVPGIGIVRNGSRSWFGIGNLGIQPSEFMKLGIIIFISKYMVKNNRNLRDIKKGVIPILGLVLFVFGLVMLEPDFGSGMIIMMIAIGLGGLFGYGFGNSRQKHFYLPEPQTDFIFSIISEEFGFLGCLIVVSLFLTIIITGFKISKKCNDMFGKFLGFGITFWIAFQATLNLMVVVGLIPVTGVTLPFLSYGGSSLLILMTSVGVLLNISRQIK